MHGRRHEVEEGVGAEAVSAVHEGADVLASRVALFTAMHLTANKPNLIIPHLYRVSHHVSHTDMEIMCACIIDLTVHSL